MTAHMARVGVLPQYITSPDSPNPRLNITDLSQEHSLVDIANSGIQALRNIQHDRNDRFPDGSIKMSDALPSSTDMMALRALQNLAVSQAHQYELMAHMYKKIEELSK